MKTVIEDNATFNIGISAGLLNEDGSSVIREVDLTPLTTHPRIAVSVLPDVDTGPLLHVDVQHLHAAILFLERVDERTLGDNSNLTLFARYGVGYDTLDIPVCTEAGVAVAIAPAGVRRPVATSVIALMLALTMNLKTKDNLTRQIPHGWENKTASNGIGLVGRTLAGIGIGNIGAEVFRLAAPFDMEFIAHDPYVDPAIARDLNIELVGLDEVFQRADVLTVNCLLNEETHHIVNAQRLAMMKSEAFLINTSRGPVVDEQALIQVLQNGGIRGAGLDVFEQEPPAPDNPLLAMDNVILAPHALCFTDQCMGGLGEADIKACLSIMHGRLPDKLVNPEVAEQQRFAQRLSDFANQFKADVS